MGTRSKTTVFDESGKPLVSLYRQFDGHFESMGQELADFLNEMAVVNGIGSGTPVKAANGMGCLAAQLVKYFKEDIGNVYLTHHDNFQEVNYDIRYVGDTRPFLSGRPGRVSLVGESYGEIKKFSLYSDDILSVKVLKRIRFVYDKQKLNEPVKWRVLDVVEDNNDSFLGYEVVNGKRSTGPKKFLKAKIVGGKVLVAG